MLSTVRRLEWLWWEWLIRRGEQRPCGPQANFYQRTFCLRVSHTCIIRLYCARRSLAVDADWKRMKSGHRPALIHTYFCSTRSMTQWRSHGGVIPLVRTIFVGFADGERFEGHVCEPDKSTRVNPARFHRIYTPCTLWDNTTFPSATHLLQCNAILPTTQRNNINL